MTLVNHLKDIEAQSLSHAVAYGTHVVTGNLAKSIVTGSSPTHVIKVQQMLGRGPWSRCRGLWWNGTEIKSDKYKFHPGTQTPAPVLKTFTADNTTNVITCTAHGFDAGDSILLAPGDVPEPLAVDVLLYVRDKTKHTFKVAYTSGGSAIDLTDNGTGTLRLWKNDDEQGVDEVFASDSPHSGFAWMRAELGSGFGEFDTKNNPPYGLKGIFDTMLVKDYDSDGYETDYGFSTSAARQVADLILRLGNRPTSRIHWQSWCDWRDFMLANIAHDYTALPDFDGVGLSAKYYNGTAFDTLVAEGIDPVLEFVSSAGSPRVGVDVDNFSVRWEGKIKAKYTETYTFYITHTHGAKLYVNGLVTPLIDEWSSSGTHSATIAMTAGTFYDIQVDWKHTTGTAELRLEWSSAKQKKDVISHRALYPKTVDRPRYETHPFFASSTRLDDAVRTILNLCNSVVQEVDGQLRFFCLEQLDASSFQFTDDNIVDGSLLITPRDVRSLRNTWQARFRDIDAQYLDFPIDPILIERPDLIEVAGRKIDGQAIEMYNCTSHQAYRTLDNVVRLNTDSKYQFALTGTADTFPVLAGDRVGLDVEFLDWTNKPCLVIESNDSSAEQTADERTFVMQEWPDFPVYE